MADPLSTIASAAGIISLGIQVIEKIIVYCDAWNGYDKDIRYLAHKASGLSKTLKHLEDVLQHLQNVDSSYQKQIKDLMDSSKVTIDKLKEMTDKIPSPCSGSKAAFGRRALYPLRKQSLVDAAGMLDSLQANINTALSVLQLYQGSVAHNTLSQELHTQHSSLQGQLAEQNAQLERMESMIRHMVDNRLQVAPSLLQSMQDENRHAMAVLKCSSAYTLGTRRAAPQQSQVLEKKIRLQSRFLRFSLTLALSITKGAGGCSIAPTLIYHGITAHDFRILIGEYFRDRPVQERNYLQCCHYLFEKRIIRPSDTQTNGDTLLEAVLIRMMSLTFWGRANTREEPSGSLHEVTRYLIEAGVPVDSSKDTLLNLLLRWPSAKNWSDPAISEIIDAGSYITDKALDPSNRKEIQYFILHYPEAVYISYPARVLVQEDEESFSRIVRRGQLSGNDMIGDYEAIELAIGWPSGVEILLAAGMDTIPPDAFDLAAEAGCISSLKLLLEAGIGLTRKDIQYTGRTAKNGEMDLLIAEIIFRRTKLRDLAIACLPEHKWRGIGVSRDALPDLTAPRVYETLRAHGVNVPKRLRPLWYHDHREPNGDFSVFHIYHVSVQYMQRLYDAGLTDIDEPDSHGYTPLMCTSVVQSPHQLLSRARWLVSKGADPSRTLPGTGVPALHAVVNKGIWLSFLEIQSFFLAKRPKKPLFNKPFANLDQQDLSFLIKAIAQNTADTCSCSCSRNGCTPLSVGLKNLRSQWSRDRRPAVMATSELLRLLPASSTIMETIIRLMVFEDLDLAHTCCDTGYLSRFDQDERRAIHEEQEDVLSELEELVDEFMDLYNRLNLPLLQFLQEHWCPRMQDYLQQGQLLSDEDLGKAREIGVDLSPSCPLRPDAWCVLLQSKITETREAGQTDHSKS